MKGIKVSILIPMWNVRSYIERSVQSVYNQTYKNIECILIDDGSTDGTYDELQRVLASLPSSEIVFRPYRREENKGVAATRNELIDKAEGDYIFWLDADDWLELDAIEALVAEQQRTNADILFGNICFDADMDNLICKKQFKDKDDFLIHILSHYDGHEGANRMVRRSLLGNDIRFTPGLDFGEDWLILVKLLFRARRLVHVCKVTYHYCTSNENSLYISAKSDKDFYEKNLKTYLNLQEIELFVKENEAYLELWKNLMLGFLFREIFLKGISANEADIFETCYPLFANFSIKLKRRNIGLIMSILTSSSYLIRFVPLYIKIRSYI